MTRRQIAMTVIALAALVLTLMNAAWLAPKPRGSLALIAHRGIGQPVDRARAGAAGACDARAIRVSGHNLIENTQFSMQLALAQRAQGLLLDVQASSDGRAVIFRDATLECRTNGAGRVSAHPLATLKTLDVGFGYTADDGRSFPMRGRGVGGMMTVAEVLQAFPRTKLLFDLADARAAEAAVGDFARAGVAIGPNHGFLGPPDALARLRQLTRGGWLLDRRASEACLSSYRLIGWLGIVPSSCRGVTVHVTYDGEWTLWGWPYRMIDRFSGADGRFFLSLDPQGPQLIGLEQPEQLGEVPRHYAGMLLIEDMNEVGRALIR